MEDKIRDNKWAVTAIAVGAALALLAGLWFALGPSGSPTNSPRAGTAPDTGANLGFSQHGHKHHSKGATALAGPSGPANGGGTGFGAGFGSGGHPGGFSRSLGRHVVVVSVSSPSATASRTAYWYLGRHGETSGAHSFIGSSWSHTVISYGGSGNVRMIIQTGQDGIPVTCRISFDGHVITSETTHGPYGAVLCRG